MGANFYIQQVRSVAKFDADLSIGELARSIIAHAPYKGMKQAKSSSKVLSALAKRLQGDLERVQDNFDISTNWAGNAIQSPDWKKFNKNSTKAFESHHMLNSNGATSGLLHTTKENINSSLNLATEKENGTTSLKLRFRVPPRKPKHIIRFKVPKTTENNGIAKSAAPKKIRLILNLNEKDKAKLRLTKATPKKTRLILKLSEEDKAELAITSKITPKTRLILNLSKEDQAELRRNTIQAQSERLVSVLQSNGKQYNSTRFYPVSIKTPKTEEQKEDEKLSILPERFLQDIIRYSQTFDRSNEPRHLNSDWYNALKIEETKPTLVRSQVQIIRNKLATRAPRQHPSYQKKMSKYGVKATQSAQQVFNCKTQIVTLIRTMTEHNQFLHRMNNIEKRHILSAVPMHMRMNGMRGAATVAEGRIEHGIEASWTAKKRNFEEIASASEDEIKTESAQKRLRIKFIMH